MKIFSIFSVLLILMNCRATKIVEAENLSINGDCIENLNFKKIYFANVEKVSKSMKIGNSRLYKDSSLLFISKYAHVNTESMLNYARMYPLGIYEQDKIEWIKWYEDNKCKNIRFKK